MGSFRLLFVIILLAVMIVLYIIYKYRSYQEARPIKETPSPGPQEDQRTVAEQQETRPIKETPSPEPQEDQRAVAEQQETRPIKETPSPGPQEDQRTVAEQAEKTVAEEAPPAPVEETRSTIVQEAQPTTIPEEIQTSHPEETASTVTEWTQPQGAGEVQLKGTAVERRRLEPIKRGGKPRGPAQDLERGRTQGIQSHRLNPEIVCWKRERQWVVAVEVPEELLEKPGLTVLQSGSSLLRDEIEEACWRLEQVSGDVIVRWNEAEAVREVKVNLGQENYLLFKLTGQNQGRRVKSPSSGPYLVIASNDWKRDEMLAGPPLVRPEPTSLVGYQAHFFDLERGGDQEIAFHLPDGQRRVIKAKAPRFDLVGNRIEDASEHMGPLFGGGPPRIRALDAQAWQEVSTVVIGKEGRGQRKWRTEFRPDPDKMEQDLPSEVAARKGGWYFLRFYDRDGDLIESMDFRFLSVLKEVRVHQPSRFLPEEGHGPVWVEFVHEAGCAVQPSNDSASSVQIEYRDDRTILSIPPDPTCDETRWLVGQHDGPHVEVTILVERLWWAVGEEGNPPSEWKDRPLTLLHGDFAATSRKALWLRLPRRRWVDRVFVGFEQSKARGYPVKGMDRTVAIALRDFGDAIEAPRVGRFPFKLWINLNERRFEGIVCELEIKMCCRLCDFATYREEDLLSHIHASHLSDFVRHLTYEELRERIPSLPYKIYQCSYCNYYVESDDVGPTISVICNHIERDCPKAPRGIGKVQISFRIVSDPDEIRQFVIKNLPRIYKCNLCGLTCAENDMMNHLVGSHRNELYKFC
ncbi:hypothetical protein [Thermoflexus sp.]|uniref:hypothetical protein n=1 Tax=Thermoflexus sp. TaxID=1969742 RepID=UPI0035E43CFE